MWKPGQLVTIENKVYRVKHSKNRRCRIYPRRKVGLPLSAVCIACYTHCGYYEYLEEIRPKVNNHQNERKCCNNRTSSRTS